MSDRGVAEGGDRRVMFGESDGQVGRGGVSRGAVEPAEPAQRRCGWPRVATRSGRRWSACVRGRSRRRGTRAPTLVRQQVERVRVATDRGDGGGAPAEGDPDAGERRACDLVGAPARGAAGGHRHHRGGGREGVRRRGERDRSGRGDAGRHQAARGDEVPDGRERAARERVGGRAARARRGERAAAGVERDEAGLGEDRRGVRAGRRVSSGSASVTPSQAPSRTRSIARAASMPSRSTIASSAWGRGPR